MRQPRRRALLGCALLPLFAFAFPPPVDAGDETVFLVRVDLDAARAADDVGPDDVVLERVGEVLERRLKLLHPGREMRREVRGTELELRLSAALAGTAVRATTEALEMPGRLRIWIAAHADDGVDLRAQTARLDAWLERHPDAAVLDFNAVSPQDGGPAGPGAPEGGLPGIRWGVASAQGPDDHRTERERAVPLLVPVDPAWRFRTEDLEAVYESQDRSGFPAIGFEMRSERKLDFGAFTAAHVGRLLAIEIDGRCVSMATIHERLPGAGIILGRFTVREAQEMVAALRSGELPAPVDVVEIQ